MHCSSCGVANEDTSKFCSSCGAPMATPVAPPGAPQSAGRRGTGAYVAVAVLVALAVIAGAVIWTVFFKPLSPENYELAVQEQFEQLEEGVILMGQAVTDVAAGSQGGLSAADLEAIQEDFSEGESMAREACETLSGLRAPDEHLRAQRDIEAYTAFMTDDVIEPFSSFISQRGADEDSEAVTSALMRVSERSSRKVDAMRERQAAIVESLYLSSDLDPLQGLALSPAKVVVSWEQPVDVDLKVYDMSGNSWSEHKDRDATGGAGEQSETLEFTEYEGADLSTGRYQIAVFYASTGDTDLSEVDVTVSLTLPSGAVVERSGWVDFDSMSDEWYVFELDPATGEYSELDWSE